MAMKGLLSKQPRNGGFFSSASEHFFELKPASGGRPATLVWPKGQITVDSRCTVELTNEGGALTIKSGSEWLVLTGDRLGEWHRSLKAAIYPGTAPLIDVLHAPRPASAPVAKSSAASSSTSKAGSPLKEARVGVRVRRGPDWKWGGQAQRRAPGRHDQARRRQGVDQGAVGRQRRLLHIPRP